MLVERYDLVHDETDHFWITRIDPDFVALIDAELDVDLIGIDTVLKTEDGRVDLQLPGVLHENRTSLEIEDPEDASTSFSIHTEAYGIGRAVAVDRVVEHLFRRHAEPDGVVDVQIHGRRIVGQLHAETDALVSESMKVGASLSRHSGLKTHLQLLQVVVDPGVLASA